MLPTSTALCVGTHPGLSHDRSCTSARASRCTPGVPMHSRTWPGRIGLKLGSRAQQHSPRPFPPSQRPLPGTFPQSARRHATLSPSHEQHNSPIHLRHRDARTRMPHTVALSARLHTSVPVRCNPWNALRVRATAIRPDNRHPPSIASKRPRDEKDLPRTVGALVGHVPHIDHPAAVKACGATMPANSSAKASTVPPTLAKVNSSKDEFAPLHARGEVVY